MILDYPWYFIIVCLLVGGIYSILLYYFKNKDSQLSRGLKMGLGMLRFIVVSIVAMLLLVPVIKRTTHQQEKPIVLIAEDHSLSVGDDTIFDYHLNKDYDVIKVPFGGTTTDISAALQELSNQYQGRNVGAMVLVSDGIYNMGKDPTTQFGNLPYPIYTVALGDTTHYPDASINNVRYNKIAYLGSQFPIEVTITANGLRNQQHSLTITCDGKQLMSKPITYNSNRFSTTESVVLEASKPGVHKYTFKIDASDKEKNKNNNTYSIIVEVIDGHQKVAIIGAAPHPDLSSLKQSIEANENYEVETYLYGELRSLDESWFKKYNLLILHNLPNKISTAKILNSGIPTLYVIGSQTDLTKLNAKHAGLEIYTKLQKTNETVPIANAAYSSFTLSKETLKVLENMPPLLAPFGDYKLGGGAQVLFTARIGSVDSHIPMIVTNSQQGVRSAFISGEGLWKWRLNDYQQTNSHEHFDELINKLVVYTSMQLGKERLRISAQNVYRSDESVIIDAELYNDNYEPVNDPDVQIRINQDDFTFNRSGNGYQLNLGVLEPGQYQYVAKATLGSQHFNTNGAFLVEEINLEQRVTTANHSLLNTLSHQTGGKMLYKEQLTELPKLLKARDDIKTIVYSNHRYSDIINLPWIFVLIIVLLAIEWITRKYNGEI